jgi:hypothetical protein
MRKDRLVYYGPTVRIRRICGFGCTEYPLELSSLQPAWHIKHAPAADYSVGLGHKRPPASAGTTILSRLESHVYVEGGEG